MASKQLAQFIPVVASRTTLVSVASAIGTVATEVGPHLERVGSLLRENGPVLTAWARRHAES